MYFDETQPSWPHIHHYYQLNVGNEYEGFVHLSERICRCWDDPDVHDQCVCRHCIEMYRRWDAERSFMRIAKAKPIGTTRVRK